MLAVTDVYRWLPTLADLRLFDSSFIVTSPPVEREEACVKTLALLQPLPPLASRTLAKLIHLSTFSLLQTPICVYPFCSDAATVITNWSIAANNAIREIIARLSYLSMDLVPYLTKLDDIWSAIVCATLFLLIAGLVSARLT